MDQFFQKFNKINQSVTHYDFFAVQRVMEFFWALKLQFFSLFRNVFITVTILLFWELPLKLANFLLSQGERIPVFQNVVSSCVDSFFDFSHVAWKIEFVRGDFANLYFVS